MRSAHQTDPDDREHRFFRAMFHCQRAAHEGQARHGNHKWSCTAMADCPQPDGNRCDECSQGKADAMYLGREQETPTYAEHGHEHDSGNAMQQAQPGKEQANPVQPSLIRGLLFNHAPPCM